MTYHDNEVSIQLSDFYGCSLVEGKYTIESYCVTSGQDPDGNIKEGLVETFGSDGKMSFRIGRKGSEDTTDWFNNEVNADQTTFNHAAEKLNFAFIGTLELTLSGDFDESEEVTFTFSNVAIAQGSTGTSNNWWFGGTDCEYIGNNEVACSGTNTNGANVTFDFKRGSNPVNVISLMASDMTYRDNEVSISILSSSSSAYTLNGGSYTIESHSITDGQDPLGNIYDGLVKTFGNDGKMSFRVGRKGSKDTAEWFNDRIDANQTTFDHAADKLNFAFIGTLELTLSGDFDESEEMTFTFLNVAIAQGRAGTSNNWWFGGTNCFYIGNHEVSCMGTGPNGTDVIFEFLRGGNDVNIIETSPVKVIDDDTANWMGELEDSVNLNEIMMPGSHDAGMSELHHCAPAAGAKGITQTQGESIVVQLLDGSRYFDIRVDYDYDELVTYHRSGVWGCNGQDLKSVLDQTTYFLSEHTEETVFLKFSHIRDDSGHDAQSTKEKINDFLNDYSTHIYTNASESINLCEVPLSSVRGKMILVFDYDEFIDPATGRFRYKDGSSKKSGNLTAYDEYSNTDDYDTMKEDQLNKWEEYGGLGKEYLFLLSWTLTSDVGKPSVETLAEEANSNLPGVLYDQIVAEGKSKPNIVYVDYMDCSTAQCIIQYNF